MKFLLDVCASSRALRTFLTNLGHDVRLIGTSDPRSSDETLLAVAHRHELLQLEDIKIGTGPIAAAGRRVIAEITVRYQDGTLVYEGPVVAYWGMIGETSISNSWQERGLLSLEQQGIALGLNGMAVGGKRRMTIAPNLVCYSGTVSQSLNKAESPGSTCMLAQSGVRGKDGTEVQKLPLIVQASLTAACAPVFVQIPLLYSRIDCRESLLVPERKPDDPIWRFYVVETTSPYKR